MKRFLLLLTGIFLISLASANILIIPNPITITTDVGTTSSSSMTIVNNFSFNIEDFKFNDLENKGFKFPLINIPSNTNRTYAFEVNATSSFYGTIGSLVTFKFPVNIPEEITTYQIKISETGLDPTYLTIRKGDTISWINNDDITHRIYSSHFGTITISPGFSNSFTFSSVGEFHYYDQDFSMFNEFNGDIQVVERTSIQLAHNPNYDYTWQVNYNAISDPTNISITNSKSYLQVEHASSQKGLITITNLGTVKAEGIHLSSNSQWINFNKNDFDLNPGNDEYIEYTIFPFLSNTSDSDKNYTINMGVKAFNSNEENTSLIVYVPYKEITGDLDSDLATLQYLNNFYCPKNPCSIFCTPEAPQCSLNGGINGTNQYLTANISTLDLYNTLKDLGGIRERLERLENDDKLFQEKYGISVGESLNISNQSLAIQNQNLKNEKVRLNTTWAIILFVILIGASAIILRKWRRKAYENDLIDPSSKY